MSRSRAQSPYSDISNRFVHDAKNNLEVDSGTSREPSASHRRTPDVESESDEETAVHATPTPDGHPSAGSNHAVSSADHVQVQGEPITGLISLDRKAGPRVRFRSRVRISAGMGRRRRFSDGLSSNASSISGSPSSSISAPLRTHHTGKNGWGPLGSRINQLRSQVASSHLPPSSHGEVTSMGNVNMNARCARSWQAILDDDDRVDEHTHLMAFATRYSYVGNRYAHDRRHDDEEQDRWWREQLMEEVFGRWPGRLLNRHWWWWNLEPILCCLCDPDE